MGGAASQRRTIALLAVISASGKSGVRRDKILELIWPDAEPERARHALTQALYHARKSLGSPDLFISDGNDLRTNPKFFISDVSEFEQSIANGDFAKAAELYDGPFLDGFSLPSTPEFERWITQQRTRLADKASQAMDTAAAKAERDEDWPSAVDWLKRLATLEPVRGSVAVRLMRAMAASGNRAGALQHARTHAEIVERELETSVDPAVSQLEQQLRAESAGTTAAANAPAIVGAETHASPETSEAAAESSESDERNDEETQPLKPNASNIVTDDDTVHTAEHEVVEEETTGRLIPVSTPIVITSEIPHPIRAAANRRVRTLAMLALTVVVVVGIIWAVIANQRNEFPSPNNNLIVVTPFRVTGFGPDISYLSEGVMDLLIATLTNASEIKAVDAGITVRAWRDAGGTSAGGVALPAALDIARRFGGTQLVGGTALVEASKLTITGWLADVATGQIEAQATVEGSPDSLTSLIDHLSARLVAVRAGQPAWLADRASGSLVALRAYLAGRALFRSGQFETAARQFEASLARDTTFGEAAFWLMLSGQRANQADRRERGLRLAWASKEALTDADRAYLTAFAGPRYPLASSAREHLQAWETALSRSPDQPEAWQQFGEILFQQGTVLGIRDARERAERAFRRARSLDPSFALPIPYLVQLAALDGNKPALDSLSAVVATDSSDDGDFARWRLALATGDNTVLRRERARFARMPLQSLRSIAMSAQYDSGATPDAIPAATMLVRRSIGQEARLDALLALHSAALRNQRLPTIQQTLRDMDELSSGSRLAKRMRVTDALYSIGDSIEAQKIAASLQATTRFTKPPVQRGGRVGSAPRIDLPSIPDREIALDRCVAAQWELRHSVTRSTREIEQTILDLRETATHISDDGTLLACSALLEATVMAGRDAKRFGQAIDLLDSLIRSGAPISELRAYLPVATARLLRASGDAMRADLIANMRPYMRGWPMYR